MAQILIDYIEVVQLLDPPAPPTLHYRVLAKGAWSEWIPVRTVSELPEGTVDGQDTTFYRSKKVRKKKVVQR